MVRATNFQETDIGGFVEVVGCFGNRVSLLCLNHSERLFSVHAAIRQLFKTNIVVQVSTIGIPC
jgi:hypothetical protein